MRITKKNVILLSGLILISLVTSSWYIFQQIKPDASKKTENIVLPKPPVFPEGYCLGKDDNKIILENLPPPACETAKSEKDNAIAEAVCTGLDFLADNELVYIDELIIGDFLARRFGANEFSGFWDKYKDMQEGADTERAKQLYAYSRMLDASAEADKVDFNDLHTLDSYTMHALYCKEKPLPDDFQEQLNTALAEGSYKTSHVLLALIFLKDQACLEQVDEEFIQTVYKRNIELFDDENSVTDLSVEVAAFLSYLEQGDRIPQGFLNNVLRDQETEGGWQWGASDRRKGTSVHTTVLALWYLYENLYPGRDMKFVSPCKR